MIKRTCTSECDKKTLIILTCKSLVRHSWSMIHKSDSSSKENITAFERVQKHPTKFILKTDLSYPERLVKLTPFPLEYRREILGLCFFFKSLSSYIDFDVLLYLNFKTPSYKSEILKLF